MSYTPTSDDFERLKLVPDSGYQPTAEDFNRLRMVPKSHISPLVSSTNFPFSSDPGASVTPDGGAPDVMDVWKGARQGAEHEAKSKVNALAQLFGSHPFEIKPLGPVQSSSEMVGREGAKMGVDIAGLLPFIAGGEAAIPGLVGASVGAGVGGGLLQKGGLKERGLAALEDALLPIGAKALKASGRYVKAAFKQPTPRGAADIIQGAHDPQLEFAGSLFENVLNKAKKEGVENIKLSEDMWQDILKHGPDTKNFRALASKAKEEGYEKLHKVQSDLFKKESQLRAEGTNAGTEAAEDTALVRKQLNDHIEDHFKKTGNPELAKELKDARNKYRHLKEVFYKDTKISKLVSPERAVPEDLPKYIGKDTTFHRKLRDEIPELKGLVQRQKDVDFLKKAGIGGGGWVTVMNQLKSLLGDDESRERNPAASNE